MVRRFQLRELTAIGGLLAQYARVVWPGRPGRVWNDFIDDEFSTVPHDAVIFSNLGGGGQPIPGLWQVANDGLLDGPREGLDQA